MWLAFALASGLFYSASGLLARHVLKGDKDAWAYSFYFSAVGFLVSLPLVIVELVSGQEGGVTSDPRAWALILVLDILVVAHNLLYFKANNYIPASLSGVITKFRLIWVFILGIALLPEEFSWLKLVGTLLTVVAGIVLIGNFRGQGSARGILYTLVATAIYAANVTLSKYLFDYFTPVQLTALVFFLPSVINAALMPQARSRIGRLYAIDGRMVLVGCAFGAFANLAMNAALNSGEATRVPVIIESFLVVVLAGEFVILKEKSNIAAKLLAVVLATAGAVIIHLA